MRSPASAKGRLKLGHAIGSAKRTVTSSARDCSPCAKALASRPVFSAHARMWQNNANKLDRCAAGLTRIYGDPE
jgi:hypothetical protein